MIQIFHLSCGTLLPPENQRAVCHVMLLVEDETLVLIDAGIGMADVAEPSRRLGDDLVRMAGFQLNEADTAVRQIQKLGFDPAQVKHIVISHADPDHVGGLTDFPKATVHMSEEEHLALEAGHARYRSQQFEHKPLIKTYPKSTDRWFTLEARKVAIDLSIDVFLVPLFGHTAGHCGVAVAMSNENLLYAADTYYLRDELYTENHPVSELARLNAANEEQRKDSLNKVKNLLLLFEREIKVFGYHDDTELRAFTTFIEVN